MLDSQLNKERTYDDADDRVALAIHEGADYLDLSCMDLSAIPESLSELTSLRRLNLDGNRLTCLPDCVGKLLSIESLSLRGNRLTSLPEWISCFTSMRSLDIADNQLEILPDSIGQLSHLWGLFLRGNRLATLPDSLGYLTAVKMLYLSSNQLTSIPSCLKKLRSLESLSLWGNQLKLVPKWFGQLTLLQELELGSNELSTLPSSLGLLTKLRSLGLWHNNLEVMPDWIGRCTDLENLHFSGNLLKSLPDWIGQLTALRSLSLDQNRLKLLPESLGNLETLELLNLSDNQLSSLPDSIHNLMNLKGLYLHGNEDLNLIPEILGPTWGEVVDDPTNKTPASPKNLLAMLKALKVGKLPLNEAKIMVLGQPMVGKSSLVRMLMENVPCDPEAATHEGTQGVMIGDWWIGDDGELSPGPIKAHVWDFGGQEIQHSAHQFFLSERCLYLVVLSSRQEEEQGRLEYWLRIIQSVGKDAPIIVILNKADLLSYSLDRIGLQERYRPNLVGFVSTSCARGKVDGIQELLSLITEQVVELTRNRDEIPRHWLSVKDAIESETIGRDWISDERFEEICHAHGLVDLDGKEALLTLLHELGVVINFRNDPRLMSLGILNPEWVTGGVYRIITHRLLGDRRGILKRIDLIDMLDLKKYPLSKHAYLLDLMRKFHVCYEYEGKEGEEYLFPNRLPKDQPLFNWNEREAVRFVYSYSVLPSSIISRFIALSHRYHGLIPPWYTGVILEIEGTRILVRANFEDREIRVSVIDATPGLRRGAMMMVRSWFERIHSEFDKIEIKNFIPHKDDSLVLLDYEELLAFENDQIDNFPKKLSTSRKSILVNVREHLEGVADRDKIRLDQAAYGILDLRGAFIGGIFMAESIDQRRTIDARNNHGTVSGNNLGDVLGELIQFSKTVPEKNGTDLAELAELLTSIGRLIDQAQTSLPEKSIEAARQDVAAVAVGAKDPNNKTLLEGAGRALRSLKSMTEDFASALGIGSKFGELVTKAGEWWARSGW